MKTHRAIKDALYEQVASLAKAMASPKRLELVELLCQAPKTVDALASDASISMKLASAHLKQLKAARLVAGERQGKNVTYRLASPNVSDLWVGLRAMAEDRLTELQQALRDLRSATVEWTANRRDELIRKARRGDIVIIDVRPAGEYDASHLPYARSMPLAELKARLAELPARKPIVAYCRGPFCLMATDAVALLRRRGFNAMHMRDGVAEWRAADERELTSSPPRKLTTVTVQST